MSVSSLEPLPSSAVPAACAATSPGPLLPHDLLAGPTADEQILKIKRAGRCSVGLVEVGQAWLERFHSAPDLLFCASTVWLKQDTDRRAALVDADFEESSVTCFMKELVTRSWWIRFAVQFFELRASNAWRQALAMRALNIRTPRPVALTTFTQNGAYHEYFLTEVIPNAMTFGQWLSRLRPSLTCPEHRTQRRIAAWELGTQLRRLHQQQFDHRDLKASNILVSEIQDGLQMWLIDLDGVWRWPILPHSRRVQNLARLWLGAARTQSVTATDALRFLKVYLGQDWRKSWKSLWTSTICRAELKLEKTRRRKRQVVGAMAGPVTNKL